MADREASAVGQFIDHDFWPLNTTLWVKDFKGNDPRFCYYLLKSLDLAHFNAGCGVPTLNRNHIHPLPVRVPSSFPEQRAIAHILGALEDKIELNRRMSETLEAMARALFKAWFVDFGPVRAKCRGGPLWPPDKGQAQGPAPTEWQWPQHILDLFPDRLMDSELGEIPEGWEVSRVGDIGGVICGKTPPTRVSAYYGDDVPFITIPDMHGKIFATTTKKRLSHAGAASKRNKMLPGGAICVSCIATPGLVVITPNKAHTNQQINSVIPSKKDETYFWYWSLRNLGDEIRAGGSGGSVLINLSNSRPANLPVLASPKRLRSIYHSHVKPLFTRILSNEYESCILASLRDALLPKLISGELRVKDAERFLKEHGLRNMPRPSIIAAAFASGDTITPGRGPISSPSSSKTGHPRSAR